ncbi:MAG TPA: type II secretion system F family protein [Nitrospiraceae bacterium]|jgi:tight adherence protein B|nr:type II secretion system F family protein [Nitrospiraceae bacterium]
MLTVLIALGIFGTILLLLQGGVLLHRMIVPRGTDRAVERIQKWSAPDVAAQSDIVRKESLSDIPWLHNLLIKMRQFQPLRVLHRQADCRVPLGIFVLATPLLALGALLFILSMHQALLLALLVAVVLGALPAGYLYWLKDQRMKMFERQLPEALELVSRALRSGHAFSVGLKLVGDEAADPIGIEFRRAFDEISMGVGLPQALQNMTDRLECVDLRFFVTSVLVQRETGGNLAEIIDSLAGMIRKRFELHLKVRALSAEGRFSAIILFALPIVVGGILYKMNPDYMSTLFTDPMGQKMLMVGSFLMVTGAIIMKRMVAIKV